MALRPLQTSGLPLGQFDSLDADLTTFKGGEVVTFTSVAKTSGVDAAAADAFDGYISPSGPKRPVVTKTLSASSRPLMLADEGVAGYGTLFGTVVGGSVGQVSYGANSTVASADLLGLHTAKASGKVTCWANAGLFAVSLDAVDTTALTGVTLSNPNLNAGSALYYTTAGLLTTASTNTTKVASFVEFSTNGSLVSTPNHLVGTLSAPDGAVSTANRNFNFAVIWFDPATA